MSRTRLSAKERKAAIVRAALPLFARKGYAETTTRDLARAAGVSEPLLYKHFPSKEALYDEIREMCCLANDPANRHRFRLIEELKPSTSSLVHLVYFLVSTMVVGKRIGSLDLETLQRLMLKSLLEDGAFARAMHKNRFKRMCDSIEASLKAAVKAGDAVKTPISVGNNALFAHNLAAWIALAFLPRRPAMQYAAPRTELVHEAVWFILTGMGLTPKAIATHYNPSALDLYFNSTND
jgi:AcrR family transcriptional regulator